jgi:hypothetical protein
MEYRMASNARSGPSPHDNAAQPTRPAIYDERIATRAQAKSNEGIPVRTVVYIEVGDESPDNVRSILRAISQHYQGNEHPIFVLPLRNRKLLTDIEFEGEALGTIKKFCEAFVGPDGPDIRLKSGAAEVDLMKFSL